MKQHLFFDLDGTLTDSMPGITRAVQYALRHYGIEVENLDLLKPFIGPPLPDSFREYYNFSEKDSLDAVPVFREYYSMKGWKENEPYEGVEQMLQTLIACGKKLYVATSKPEWMAKQVLEYFNLAVYFEFIGGASDDESRTKKADVIQYVIQNCGLQSKEGIIMIGDRSHDIKGAHAVGLEAVGVLYGYGDREELEQAGADWITESTKSLTELLKQL